MSYSFSGQGAFHDWVAQANPDDGQKEQVRDWIIDLAGNPDVPNSQPAPGYQFDARSATVGDTGVVVTWVVFKKPAALIKLMYVGAPLTPA